MQDTPHAPRQKTYSDDWDAPAPAIDITPQNAAPQVMPRKGIAQTMQALGSLPSLPVAFVPCPFPHADKPNHFPGFIARSELFGVAQVSSGPTSRGELLSLPQYHVKTTGPRLSMGDKSVWEAVVGVAKEHGVLGEEFQVSFARLAGARGWSDDGGTTHDDLFKSIQRLAMSWVDFEIEAGAVKGSGLLIGAARREKNKCWVTMDSGFCVPAFSLDTQFAMNPKRRVGMPTELSRWLHDFLSVNNDWHNALTFKRLRELCGSKADRSHFAKALEAALSEVGSLAPEVLASFTVDRATKKSANWSVKTARGSEGASYIMSPAARADYMASRAPQTSLKGRVAL